MKVAVLDERGIVRSVIAYPDTYVVKVEASDTRCIVGDHYDGKAYVRDEVSQAELDFIRKKQQINISIKAAKDEAELAQAIDAAKPETP